jgi:hypothetical protein
MFSKQFGMTENLDKMQIWMRLNGGKSISANTPTGPLLPGIEVFDREELGHHSREGQRLIFLEFPIEKG